MDATYWWFALTLISNKLFFCTAEPEFEALKIIGGNDTEPDEYRYVVAINICSKDNPCYCTGGIIDERFVISAAHCFFYENGTSRSSQFDNVTIIAGTNDAGNYQDPRRTEIQVEKIYVPLDFVFTNQDITTQGDIAVLKLSQDLQLSKNNLQKLRLPVKTQSTFAGKQAVLAGFGTTKVTYTQSPNGTVNLVTHANNKLHAANISIVANNECNDHRITESSLCGRMVKDKSAKHYGVCKGDSGGPLVYKSKVLIGVVSRGNSDRCNELDGYTVYTRVKSHIDFIENAKNDVERGMIISKWNL